MHHDIYSESGKQLSDMESILKSIGFAEPIDEAKMSKEKHKKEAKKGKRWQDSDGDGKWYEPGEDVKEGVRDLDPEKGTAERKARLEKKRGMKLDDHPEYKKEEVEIDEATAMAKRGHDETAIRNKIAKSTGGGGAADRATKLADKSTFGDSKKAKQRQDLARKQRGDFRKTTSSSPGLHGYAHKSNDPKVKAKQAARGAQRGALTPDEKKSLNRESMTFRDFVGMITERKLCNKCGQEICECANRLEEGLKQARTNIGMDPNKPSCWKGYEAKGTKMKGGKEVPNCVPKEEYLNMATEMIEEGYEEEDVRLAIEWIEDGYTVMFEEDGFYAEEILDESQEARNNPEKYEAGQKKKYDPVRGEKTPMPPRGDKRREDFEKWYAKNVR
jgi:hypothetical protein